ncbi:MAG TPA: indole-3-glycerol-phosphate synthase TrpC, partial [Clostridiales bacterium]|nr:indole-3-glycerol-phosphate synthase TrpC [Clostridiales bacterium]
MILEKLAESTRRRVEAAKKKAPFEELKSRIFYKGKAKKFHQREDFAFEKALSKEGISFICEVKKASPSKG